MDNNIIEQLLANGETPESIYQNALNIVKKNNEQEQRNKEIAEKRKTALNAFRDYLDTVVDGEPTSDAFMKKIEEEFIQIERGTRSEKPKTKERKKNMREEPLDPAFEKFLRDMGFLDD